ncbi:MAG: hypothetical protein ACYC3I_26880 [Gemmataceae bacterium]
MAIIELERQGIIMASKNLEARVAALEAEVAHLKDQILNQGVKKEGWEAMVGAFLNDPYYEKAMKYGRKYRESLRPRTTKKPRKKP